MEFWTTIAGLMRRKRVFIPAVLVALAMGAVAYLVTPVTYVCSTTMVLTTTRYGGTEFVDPNQPNQLTNPMLNFNESLRTTSSILIQAMNTKDVAARVGARGGTQLVVDDGQTDTSLLGVNGPFLHIVAKSTSPDQARRVVAAAEEVTREKLRDWQSALNAPSKTFVSLASVVPPAAPEPDGSRRLKLGVLTFILGIGLTMGTAYAGQRLGARRRARGGAAATGSAAPRLAGGLQSRRKAQANRSPTLVPELDVGVEAEKQPARGVFPTWMDDSTVVGRHWEADVRSTNR